jgi:hypothetical protein
MKLRQPIFEFYAANATSDLRQEGIVKQWPTISEAPAMAGTY